MSSPPAFGPAPHRGAGAADLEAPVARAPEAHEKTRPEELIGYRPSGVRLAVVGLFGLALLYTMYFARPVVLPMVVAVLLAFVLDPVVGALGRLRIPRPLATFLILFGLIAGGGYGALQLVDPATEWLEEAPRSFEELERKLARIKKPVEEVERATQEMQKIAQLGESEAATEVRVQEASFVASALDQMRRSFAEGLVTLVLLGFLLASGDLFLRKTVRVLPTLGARKRAVRVSRHLRREISTYLLTMGAINVGLGLAVGVAMWLLDMPNPVLWGVMAGCLNFIPYLGPTAGVIIVGLVSLLTFDSFGRALAAPAVYLALNSIEGSLVTPTVLGRRLALNPVAVFTALMLWGWLWGIPGALLAVPLVVTLKIVCDHYEPLAGFGEMLGRT